VYVNRSRVWGSTKSWGAGALLVAGLLAIGPAEAQTIETSTATADEIEEDDARDDSERFEGLTLDALEIEAPPREDRAKLIALSGLVAGTRYSAAEVRRAVKVLHQLGRFADVEAFARREGNVVRLRLVLSPRPVVRELTVRGAEQFSAEAVLRAAGYKKGDELRLADLPGRRAAIAAALERRGWASAAIGLALQAPDQEGGVELVIAVDEGPVTRLDRLVIQGQPRRPLWQIGESFGLGSGDILDLDQLEAGLQQLAKEYRALGYWDAHLAPPQIRGRPSGPDGEPRADVVLSLDSGPKTTLDIVGDRVLPRRAIDAAAAGLSELGTGPAALAEVKERITLLYARRGYWRARVLVERRVHPDGERAVVRLKIDEGPRGRVTQITFPGNVALDDALLVDAVGEAVARAFADEDDVPETDPGVVDALFDGRGTRPGPQPYATEPKPSSIYFDRGYRAGVEAIADLYRAQGYQMVEVDLPTVTPNEDGTTLAVEIAIRAGPVWRIGTLSLRGSETVEGQALLEVAGLSPGDPLAFFRVEEARRAIQQYYKARGHLYARVDEVLAPMAKRGEVGTSTSGARAVRKECEVARDAGLEECQLALAFSIREGPEVHTRAIIVRGGDGIRRALVDGEVTFATGEVLTEEALEDTQRNLLRLGVFRRATVRPIDEELEAAEKDVLIDLVESLHSSVDISAGISTEEGLRAAVTYSHGNVFGSALRFTASARGNVQPFFFLYNEQIRDAIADFYAQRPIEYLFATGLAYPRVLGLPRGFGAGLDLALVQNNEPAFAEAVRIANLTLDYSGLRPVLFGDPRGVGFQLRASVEWADLLCNGELQESGVRTDLRELCGATSDDPARRLEGTTFYTGLRLGLSIDLRDDAVEPRKGLYAEMQPELLFGWNEASPSHVNVKAKLNGYIPLFGRSSLATSLVWWQLFPFEGDAVVPVNRRFFAGGRSTIRGYPEQTIFPRGEGARPSGSRLSPGGSLMVALKTELRFPLLAGLDGALFYDVGDLFELPKYFVIDSDTRMGVGVGIRYATPIGPLLLDIAFPLSRGNDDLTWVPHFAAVGSF